MLGLCAIGLCATSLAANEAARLASLSKSAFLAEYEDRFVQSLEMSEELMRRFDPAHAGVFDSETPVSQAERDSFACLYDAMTGQSALMDLAEHATASSVLTARVESMPDFDYVDMMDPALEVEVAGMTPSDTLIAAMDGCGSMTLVSDRMAFSSEFWIDMQAAAIERGYIEAE